MSPTHDRRTDDTSTKLLHAIHAVEAERDEWEFAAKAGDSSTFADLGLAASALRLMRTLYVEGGLTLAGAKHAHALALSIADAAASRRDQLAHA